MFTCLHYIFMFDFHLLPRPFVAAVRHPGKSWKIRAFLCGSKGEIIVKLSFKYQSDG